MKYLFIYNKNYIYELWRKQSNNNLPSVKRIKKAFSKYSEVSWWYDGKSKQTVFTKNVPAKQTIEIAAKSKDNEKKISSA